MISGFHISTTVYQGTKRRAFALLPAHPYPDSLVGLLISFLQGLWMGTIPGMLLTIPYTAVQFVALQQCKDTAAKMGWEGKG